MPAKRFETWAPEFRERLRKLPDVVIDELTEWATRARKALAAAVPRETGALAKGLEVELEGGLQGQIVATADDPAAAMLEHGGPITGSPWLAVPLRRELRRFSGPRADAGLFVLRARSGALFLATRDGAGLDLRWALKRRVERAARPFLRPTMERELGNLGPDLAAAMRDAVVAP